MSPAPSTSGGQAGSRFWTRERHRVGLVLLAFLGGGMLGSILTWQALLHHQDSVRLPDQPPSPSHAVEPGQPTVTLPAEQMHAVTIAPVDMHDVRTAKQTTGRIATDDDLTTPIFPLVSGHAVKLLVHSGDHVDAGTPLAELDSPDIYQAETALIASQPVVTKAHATLDQLQRVAHRQERLYALHAVSLQDLEQAQADVRAAQSDLAAAETAQASGRGQLRILGRSDADIMALEHGGQPSRQAIIRAPLSGTIVSRQVGPGQLVHVGDATPMFSIADLSKVWMTADVLESDARWISVGQDVSMRTIAFPDEVFTATVSYVASSVDPATHRITVRCVIDNPKQRLKPEMFTTVTLYASTAMRLPCVPASAVLHLGVTAYVWVQQGQNRFTRRVVDCGPEQQGLVPILSGLAAGDPVVTAGGIFLGSE